MLLNTAFLLPNNHHTDPDLEPCRRRRGHASPTRLAERTTLAAFGCGLLGSLACRSHHPLERTTHQRSLEIEVLWLVVVLFGEEMHIKNCVKMIVKFVHAIQQSVCTMQTGYTTRVHRCQLKREVALNIEETYD